MLPKIIIDTDIGDDIDDSFALLLAVLSRKVDLLGVTTVFRETEKRAKITKAFLKTMGSHVGVYAGEDLPLNGDIVYADYDRFDDSGRVVVSHYFKDFDHEPVSSKHAVDFILESIEAYPDEVTIVAIGPMTNLARAYERSPETFRRLKSILFMGGHTTSDFKEWNIRCDVEAANNVFGSRVDMKIVGIDMTSKCRLSEADLQRIAEMDDSGFRFQLKRMLKAYIDFFDNKRLPVMHDPLTMACLIGDFCTFQSMKVDVVTEGKDRGRTIINPNSSNSVIEVAVDVDVDGFMNYFFKVMESEPMLEEAQVKGA